jgi:hypothetical protein
MSDLTSEQRIWVSEDRCILLTIWQGNPHPNVTVATREDPSHTWGPPVTLTEEK